MVMKLALTVEVHAESVARVQLRPVKMEECVSSMHRSQPATIATVRQDFREPPALQVSSFKYFKLNVVLVMWIIIQNGTLEILYTISNF